MFINLVARPLKGACRQAELGTPLLETPDLGGVQVGVECSPCAGPSYQVGLPYLAPIMLTCMMQMNSGRGHSTDEYARGDTSAWQNRAGEELAAELARRMEQCLKATPSGRGRATAAGALLLHARDDAQQDRQVQESLWYPACVRVNAGPEGAVCGGGEDLLGALHRRAPAQH